MEYNIFICHAGKITIQYRTIEKWLNVEMKNNIDFNWVDCSASNDLNNKEICLNRSQFKFLKERISRSSIVIICSDIYPGNQHWIDFELNTAKKYKKYIIGLKPWRGIIPTPKNIRKNTDILIELNSQDLIKVIKSYINK